MQRSKNRFEWVVNGEDVGPDPLFDQDLYADKSAAVIPTIGALVPGWVLVIPRQSALSISHLEVDVRYRVKKTLYQVAYQLSTFAPNTYFFEHGVSDVGSVTGCGVDQAHIHLVPLDVDLIRAVYIFDRDQKWFEVSLKDPWSTLDPSKDYYLISDFKSAYAAYPRIKRSQFFRRAIACAIDRPSEWNYQNYSHLENVRKTINFFRTTDRDIRAA